MNVEKDLGQVEFYSLFRHVETRFVSMLSLLFYPINIECDA
jgi:hypothetical protein